MVDLNIWKIMKNEHLPLHSPARPGLPAAVLIPSSAAGPLLSVFPFPLLIKQEKTKLQLTLRRKEKTMRKVASWGSPLARARR